MVLVVVAYDVVSGNVSIGKSLLLFAVVLLIAAGLAWITMRILVRPLQTLQAQGVREGRLERIRYRKSGDEIEFIARNFNQMVESLETKSKVIQENHEQLESRYLAAYRRARNRDGQRAGRQSSED